MFISPPALVFGFNPKSTAIPITTPDYIVNVDLSDLFRYDGLISSGTFRAVFQTLACGTISSNLSILAACSSGIFCRPIPNKI